MNLYGNSIWNNATPNSEKSVMVTPKENLNSVTKALDEAGVNYCYFIKDNSVAIAIARIAVNQSELENLRKITEIRSLATENPRTNYSPKSSVIGNIPYREIRNRHYQKLETDLALKVADELNKNGISFSGRIYDKTTTLTVDTADRQELERIIGDVVEVRNSYKRKIENIDIVNDTFSALSTAHKTILQPLADMCYTQNERFSETLCADLDKITGLNLDQTQRFVSTFLDVYGDLNESEYIFCVCQEKSA